MGYAIPLVENDKFLQTIVDNKNCYKSNSISLALSIAANALHSANDWAGNDYDYHYINVALDNTASNKKNNCRYTS